LGGGSAQVIRDFGGKNIKAEEKVRKSRRKRKDKIN
jgi:hypothetical protein